MKLINLLLACCLIGSASAQKIVGSDIILDASDMIDDIPRLHLIKTADDLQVPYLYNNFAIQFRTHANFTISNYMTQIPLQADGSYYIYVRSVGSGKGNFRIRLNDSYIDGDFGKEQGVELKRVGPFALKKDEKTNISITRITGSPALDAIVFSKKESLDDNYFKQNELPGDVVLIKDYDIPAASCSKFGDLNGDGKTDFVILTPNYSAIAYDNSGKELWRWDAPEERSKLRAEFEAPGVVWDFDGDGKAEFAHWRELDSQEWLVIVDGVSGKIKHKTAWMTKEHPHVYNNFRLAVANLSGKRPDCLVMYSDDGKNQNIAAYGKKLDQLWLHTENRKKDHLGHYIYPYDFDGDGIDEVLGGWVMFDSKGKVLWNLLDDWYDNHDHVDSYKIADMNGDGTKEIVIAGCDMGTQVRQWNDAKLLWQAPSEHNQQIQVGEFLSGQTLPQVAAGARIYQNRTVDPYISGQIYWFNSEGKLISKWPANALNGNPDFAKGDWYGNRTETLFWYRFMMQPDGRGKLAFTGNVYHCFDFERNGAAQVITLDRGKLRVWGYKNIVAKKANNNLNHLRETMTNHTHY